MSGGLLVGSPSAAAYPESAQGTIPCTRRTWPECPLPASVLRNPIHFAPGAIQIWLPMPSSPTIARGVRAVSLVVARERRIIPARVAHAIVD